MNAIVENPGRPSVSVFTVALLVPYSLRANHGNAVRVRQMVEKVKGVKYSTLTYDTITTHGRDVSIPMTTTIRAAYERYLKKRPVLDLLVAERPFPAAEKGYRKLAQASNVAQAENLWAVPTMLRCARQLGKPAVATFHDVYSDRVRELLRHFGAAPHLTEDAVRRTLELERNCLRELDCAVFVCEEDLKRYTELGAEPLKTMIIPNGVDTSKFRPLPEMNKKRKVFGLPEGRTLVLFPGSDMYQNREAVDNMMRVLKGPGLNGFVAVFAGSISGYALREAKACGVKAVAFGHIERLEELYAAVDAVFLPITSGTGTKLKVLEALACGKYVITTSTGTRGLHVRESCVIADDEKTQREALLGIEAEAHSSRVLTMARETAARYDWQKTLQGYELLFQHI